MTDYVHPTENDVGDGGYAGRAITELKWREIFGPHTTTNIGVWACGMNYVRTGFTYVSATGFVCTFAAGTAVIEGYTINIDNTDTVTLGASATYNVFLQLTDDTNTKIDGYQLTSQLSTVATVPEYSVLLAEVVCGTATVTGTPTDMRPYNPFYYAGSYTGTGASSGSPHMIYLGFRPSWLQVWTVSTAAIHTICRTNNAATSEISFALVASGVGSPYNYASFEAGSVSTTYLTDYGFGAYGDIDGNGTTLYFMARP
jgi:hypothetical protein